MRHHVNAVPVGNITIIGVNDLSVREGVSVDTIPLILRRNQPFH